MQAPATFVPGDRGEPGAGVARPAAAEERAVGGKEGLLRRIFRFDGIAQEQSAEPVDHPGVPGIELPGTPGGAGRLRHGAP